jgi:hypothetical protein
MHQEMPGCLEFPEVKEHVTAKVGQTIMLLMIFRVLAGGAFFHRQQHDYHY